MFRAAVLSIVLALVATPQVPLLCAVWCHSEASAAGPCEHPDTGSALSVTANDSCPDIAAASTAFVREDVRRGVAAADPQHVAVVRGLEYLRPPHSPEFGREREQHSPLEVRPLLLALRI